jgi:hypothetical protein
MYDLPPGGCLAQNQRVAARRIAAARGRALQVELSGDQRHAGRERTHFDIRERQLPHGLARRIGPPVPCQDSRNSSPHHLMADKSRLRRIVVVRGEGRQVAAIPRFFRVLQNRADVVALGE